MPRFDKALIAVCLCVGMLSTSLAVGEAVGQNVLINGYNSSNQREQVRVVNGALGSYTTTIVSWKSAPELCAPTAASTSYSVPLGASIVCLTNMGPNPITYTLDGTVPVSKTRGDVITGYDTSASGSIDKMCLPISATTQHTLKVIAATALQTTGACTLINYAL